MNKPTNEYIMAIKPEWVALIESKEKTLEIRRTAPYISPPVSENNPIDVWVYETKSTVGAARSWAVSSAAISAPLTHTATICCCGAPPASRGKSSKNTRVTAHACTPGKSPTTKSWPSRCLCPPWAASSRRNRGASAKRRKEHEKPLFLRNDPPGTRHE